MSPHTGAGSTLAVIAPPARWRVIANRFLFHGMIAVSGLIAIALYAVSKTLAWRFAKLQARNLLRLCGVRVRVSGIERLGEGPYIFTPNHQSQLDIAILLGYLPGRTRFAAKKELFRQPLFGAVLRTLGMIPIDRDDPAASMERLRRLALGGGSVVIFPEGTRSRDGALLPFKKGAFVAALELSVPVVPVVCKGTVQLMPKARYLSILPGTAEVVVLDPIPTAGMAGDGYDSLRETVRAKIAGELKI